MWILKGENFTERNPKQKRHPFSHATQVFARFENPFFFELASIYVLLVLTYFSNVWVVVESGLQVTQIEGEGPDLGLLKRPLPTPKNHPPFKKKRRKKTEQKTRNLRSFSFFCLLGRFFFFGRKVFGGIGSQLWGPWPRGSPQVGWLIQVEDGTFGDYHAFYFMEFDAVSWAKNELKKKRIWRETL